MTRSPPPGRTAPTATPGALPRLHARTTALLRTRIEEGSLPPGTLLLESKVASQLGISRAPARQALAQLEVLGLLRRSDRTGYVVAGTPRDAPPPSAASGLAGDRLVAEASWERLYAEVERAIVARSAAAAFRVVESELALAHGVSRTVAREVIARLHQRGVLRRDERGHWIAPELTARHLAELYELRALLEPAALLRAAPRLPPGLVATLLGRLDEAIAVAGTLDGPALDALEADLHVTLLGHCDSEAMCEAIRLYQSLLVAHSFLYAWGPRLFPTEPFLPEHHLVLTRLAEGDLPGAEAALREHLQASLGRAVRRIEAVKQAPPPEPLPWLQKRKAG